MVTTQSYLLEFQLRQLSHDERYHRDVVLLPLGERLKHMALHFAKYVGYLAENEGAEDAARVQQILVDSFIISLATANALNLDIHRELREAGAEAADLPQLGAALHASVLPNGSASALNLLRAFARHTGALAKACESLDHLEAFPFRDSMRASTIAIFKLVVAAAAGRDLDLAELYRKRLRVVEERSIFDIHLRALVV